MSIHTQDESHPFRVSSEVSLLTIRHLFQELTDDNLLRREQARSQLVAIGGAMVIRAFVCQLGCSRREVRWESAKALCEIRDPVVAPVLAYLLHDSDRGIRWLAAEGPVTLGMRGLAVAAA